MDDLVAGAGVFGNVLGGGGGGGGTLDCFCLRGKVRGGGGGGGGTVLLFFTVDGPALGTAFLETVDVFFPAIDVGSSNRTPFRCGGGGGGGGGGTMVKTLSLLQ